MVNGWKDETCKIKVIDLQTYWIIVNKVFVENQLTTFNKRVNY